jgi:phosphoribosylanthranilate isomerase
MTVEAKICGIKTRAALEAAVEGGARYVGFVFYARSPRFVTPEDAGVLARAVPAGVAKVGLLVDMDDAFIENVLAGTPLDMLQLHGQETPARAAAIKARFGVDVMKAIKLGAPSDVTAAAPFLGHVDRLLFDSKTPPGMTNALPGGNAVAFDWTILKGARFPVPWMLSGGLTPENVAEAIATTGARAVDVSSGVEDAPGQKSPARIKAFLDAVKAL